MVEEVRGISAHPVVWHWNRLLAIGLASASLGAMLYVGLYQSRAVRHIWCPIFSRGCEAVANARFAKPFGVPDGYIAAALYALILLLLSVPTGRQSVWLAMLVLASTATLANILGIRDMIDLGSYCFYCMLTTVLSPILLLEIWWLR